MSDQVLFSDLEVWLCGEIRAKLPALPDGWTAAHIDVKEPQPRPAGLIILVHVDGGPRDLVTRDQAVRIRIIAPDQDTLRKTAEIARRVDLILASSARVEPGNPIAAFLGSQGPVRVANTDTDRAEYLIVAQLREAGREPVTTA